jgi:hypothetical protein
MGVLPNIKKLDDALGHFLVQITCKCGAQRTAEPEALTRLCGPSATLETVSRRMRCSKCGHEGRRGASPSLFRGSAAEDSLVEAASKGRQGWSKQPRGFTDATKEACRFTSTGANSQRQSTVRFLSIRDNAVFLTELTMNEQVVAPARDMSYFERRIRLSI